MKHALFAAVATVLSTAAAVVASGPCWLFVHQEDLPKELLAKN